ncbi:hypothetical protein [Polynucleobacter antarcticus]|uniref:DUF2946 domain-containing protein n=1 Tax=Polynucleobacter antarcticus TaxID=1743162 RepID=A0A6M9Q2E1_9BURK|nr:hypothetical protein [Polynucleobacter antarcticus]QKM62463.1 hypothetical protein DCO16_04930 [Polynucleobacter antarcticus]
MFKRLLLLSLIVLTPVQSWAVLDMRGKQSNTVIERVEVAPQLVVHPCHQDVQNGSEVTSSVQTDSAGCNSCTLCMAFGLLPTSNPALVADVFTQRFYAPHKTILSADIAALIKPPIL